MLPSNRVCSTLSESRNAVTLHSLEISMGVRSENKRNGVGTVKEYSRHRNDNLVDVLYTFEYRDVELRNSECALHPRVKAKK